VTAAGAPGARAGAGAADAGAHDPQAGHTGLERRGVFSAELLDRCISCGFCLPACPTYKRTADETSSPRGRINLMRALETGRLGEDDPTVLEESSFCLGCRACEPVCPAGVQYGALLEEWRDRVWRRRPLKLRLLLWATAKRWRVRTMGVLSPHARRRSGAAGDGAVGPHLMLGCFERVIQPGVSRAAATLIDGVHVSSAQGCCGALHAHNGELERGRALAGELGDRLPGTIVTTAGGCAAHLSAVLGPERVRELSQWLDDAERRKPGVAPGLDPGPTADPGPAPDPRHPGPAPDPDPQAGGATAPGRPRIALQDSCHLRNALGVHRQPRALIERVGEYVELPSAAECCGAAGTYALLRPRDSRRILDDKLAEIEAAEVDVVVCLNPGCLRQLRQGLRRRGLRTRAVHLAQLLADAPKGAGSA
jgi:glycolate oxidase iron-sulfur subunit